MHISLSYEQHMFDVDSTHGTPPRLIFFDNKSNQYDECWNFRVDSARKYHIVMFNFRGLDSRFDTSDQLENI